MKIADTIKQRGHWRVRLFPTTYQSRIDNLLQLQKIVEGAQVSLRGSHFPHIDHQNDSIQVRSDYVEHCVDWGQLKELWRLYRSMQFVLLRGLHEDWDEVSIWLGDRQPRLPGELLAITDVITTLTEVFSFASRLMARPEWEAGLTATVELVGTKDRRLDAGPGRMPFMSAKVASEKSVLLEMGFADAGSLSQPRLAALGMAQLLFRLFKWDASLDSLQGVADQLERGG